MNERSPVRPTRRGFLLTLFATAVPAGLLQACGGGTAVAPTAPPAPKPTEAAKPAAASPAAAKPAVSPAAAKPAASPAAAKPAASPAAKPAASPAAAPSPAAVAPGFTGPTQRVRYGDLRLLSDGGVYIGIQEGFFRDQGIEIELVNFDSAANMVAPLGTNQIDAGGGALSAGLYNALGRGVKLAIVADKGHARPPSGNTPGGASSQFIVRKALVDSGVVKSAADLKGRKFAWVARGISTELDMQAFLKEGGLTMKDLELVQISFPDQVAALANGAIDGGAPGEPFAITIQTQGTGVVLKRDFEVNPGNQVSALLYSPQMASSELGTRFMIAYLRGVRLYNDAFVKRDPAARDRAIPALIANTPIKDRALYDRMLMQALHPDGTLNVPSMQTQQDYFLAEGFQQTRINLPDFVNTKFVEDARRTLGAYA